MPQRISPEAKDLHAASIVIDGHNDYIIRRLVRGLPIALDEQHKTYDSDGPRLLKGGMTASLFMVGGHYPARSLALIEKAHQSIEARPDLFLLATSTADIRKAKKTGRLAVLLSWESGTATEGRIEVLQAAYRLGVRVSTITHNEGGIPHALQGSPTPGLYCTASDRDTFRRTNKGLTSFGREVVQEMDRLGMVIDLAHANDAAIEDMLSLATKPVISSHGGAFALCPHSRCSTDEQIKAIAATGGLLSVVFYGKFLMQQPGKAKIDHIVDHIAHIADLVGTDHIGIGSDYDGLPEGVQPVIPTADKLPLLTQALLKRGFKDSDIRKILGKNYMRVLKQVIDSPER